MINSVNYILPLYYTNATQNKNSHSYDLSCVSKTENYCDTFVKSKKTEERPVVEVVACGVDSASGDKYLNVEIYDDIYRFKCDENLSEKRLEKMIGNIEKSYTGFLARRNKHEEFIPYMFKGVPDIKKDYLLLKYGNAETVPNLATRIAAEKLNRFLHMDVNVYNLKTINYMVNTEEGYDNNDERVAYSVYDDEMDDMYLYLPDEGVLKRIYDCGFVKTFEIY